MTKKFLIAKFDCTGNILLANMYLLSRYTTCLLCRYLVSYIKYFVCFLQKFEKNAFLSIPPSLGFVAFSERLFPRLTVVHKSRQLKSRGKLDNNPILIKNINRKCNKTSYCIGSAPISGNLCLNWLLDLSVSIETVVLFVWAYFFMCGARSRNDWLHMHLRQQCIPCSMAVRFVEFLNGGYKIFTEKWKPMLNFSTFSVRGSWGQPMLLF